MAPSQSRDLKMNGVRAEIPSSSSLASPCMESKSFDLVSPDNDITAKLEVLGQSKTLRQTGRQTETDIEPASHP